jgi:hypothetical protein
MSKAWKRP